MSLDKLIVVIIGLLGVLFIYWFFLMKKNKEVETSGEVDITVSGGYSPEVISVPVGKTTRINFTRTDPTECLSEVVLSDFKIRKELPLNKKITIEIAPQKKGDYEYSCGMGMYHGKIVVR